MDQTTTVDEVILVDDASDPPLTMAAAGIADDRVRLLTVSRNRGAAAARWTGVEHARGDLVAFLDSDDFWFGNKLEIQLRSLAKATSEARLVSVVCGWEVDRGAGRPKLCRTPIEASSLADFVSGCWFCPGSTLLVPRTTLQEVGPFDSSLRRLEDYEWFVRFGLAGGRLVSAPVIGACIAQGRWARSVDVNAAAAAILERFDPKHQPAMTPDIWRSLRAWLYLEQAAASRNEGQLLATAYYLARSFALMPRTRLHLGRWWLASPADSPGPGQA